MPQTQNFFAIPPFQLQIDLPSYHVMNYNYIEHIY